MALKENNAFDSNFLSIKHHGICKELKPAPQTDEERAEAIANKFFERDVPNPSKPLPNGGYETVKKWIRLWGSLEGIITGLEWYDRTHDDVRYVGVKMKIKDPDTKEVFLLDLPFAGKGYDVFTRVMEDIDYTKPMEISVWQDKSKRNASAVLFRQDGDSIKWRYTREWNGNIVKALGANQNTVDLAEELSIALENGGSLTQDLIDRVAAAGFLLAPPPVHNPLAKPQWNFDAQRAFLYQRLTEVVIPHVEELNPKFDDPQPDYVADETPADAAPVTPNAPTNMTGPTVPAPEVQAAAAPAEAPGPWTPPGAPEKKLEDAPF